MYIYVYIDTMYSTYPITQGVFLSILLCDESFFVVENGRNDRTMCFCSSLDRCTFLPEICLTNTT